MWEQIFQIALPGLIGALVSGVPLYIQIRRVNAEIKTQAGQSFLDQREKSQSIDRQAKIDVEAEWKRMLDEKDKDIVRLRLKDDEQEAKIGDLLNRHIECKQNEARQDERAKFHEKRSEEQGREVRALTNKVLQLEKLIREKLNAPEQPSSESSGGTLLVQQSTTQEEARP